jgi:uncharacterized membrane protein SpoIIM required for sporulation
MMTPLQFESQHAADWQSLEEMVRVCRLSGRRAATGATPVQAEQFCALYRRMCEQLALARQRAYPAHLVDRLERVTADAHQLIYQRREFGLAGLRSFLLRDFPRAVRQHRHYVLVSTLLFALPMLVTGWLIYRRPDLVLSLVDANTAAMFEDMYSSADALGRPPSADGNWAMFAYYIRHNIGIAFQCFAGGILFGVGSIFYLVYNGAFVGGIAGYITERGLGSAFYSFVVTHSAFELTAIVLSGAAGLRIGHALVSPGQLSRRASLVAATSSVAPVIYGFSLLLLVAAAIEGFWSSATWLPGLVRYSVAAICWAAVLAYFFLQGRSED